MDYLRKLKLILAIEGKLSEIDTSYSYQDMLFNNYECTETVCIDVCNDLIVDYDKYINHTVRQLEKELIDNIIE